MSEGVCDNQSLLHPRADKHAKQDNCINWRESKAPDSREEGALGTCQRSASSGFGHSGGVPHGKRNGCIDWQPSNPAPTTLMKELLDYANNPEVDFSLDYDQIKRNLNHGREAKVAEPAQSELVQAVEALLRHDITGIRNEQRRALVCPCCDSTEQGGKIEHYLSCHFDRLARALRDMKSGTLGAQTETATEEEMVREFEDGAHEIFGDATRYLEKRTHDGHIEYVRGDVESSWAFFKHGFDRGLARARSVSTPLHADDCRFVKMRAASSQTRKDTDDYRYTRSQH